MKKGFDFEQFARKMKQEAYEVIPPDLTDNDKQYIIETIYNFVFLAGKTLANDDSFKDYTEEQTVFICLVIAEWTFHKAVDLIYAGIEKKYHDEILQKIAFTIFEICKQTAGKDIPQNTILETIELQVRKTYNEAIMPPKSTCFDELLDIKKLFTNGSSIGRLDYFRITWELPVFYILIVLLAIVIPPDNWLCYPVATLALITLLTYLVIFLAATYKRLDNILDNAVLSAIFLTVVSFCSIIKPLFFAFNILLIFLPGKKKTDRIVSGKLFWIIILPLMIIIFSVWAPGIIRRVPNQAMADTLQVRDRIVINIFDKNYRRGDIIIHKTDKKGVVFLKRIIALPGEKVEIKQQHDGAFHIFINGKLLNEPYVKDIYNYPDLSSMPYSSMIVPDNSYYVVSDNRENSFDSRYYGAIHKNRIKGKVSHIWYPFNRRHVFTPQKYSFYEPHS